MMIELIAEVASNHGGDVGLAKEFIWRFAEAGADWIKFQHTRVRHLRPDDPQYGWFRRAEFSTDQFAELKATCEQAGTKFLTTVYHAADVPEVVGLGCETVKIGSGEACEPGLFRALQDANLSSVIVGCGLAESHKTPYWLWEGVLRRFLACVSRYPHPSAASVLNRYGSFYDGWSDHARGLEAAELAVLQGARIIEKHVQLPNQARPCQPWEATVQEFQALRAFADDDPIAKYVGRWQHA